jgi:hypothetical protein
MNSLKIILLTLIIGMYSNQSVLCQPVADFSIDRYNVCSGITISLTNISSGANRYEWFIEGNHYSFATDTIAKLMEPCYDLKEIKLIAIDSISGLTVEHSEFIEVFDSCFFHWTGTILICPGDTIVKNTSTEAIQTLWNINPSPTYITGCDTCSSISFVPAGFTILEGKFWYAGGCSEITTMEYVVTCPFTTNINEDDDLSEITIGPNPAYFEFSISGLKINHIYEVTILNSVGQIYLSKKVTIENNVVNMKDLSMGIYFMKIGNLTKKIVKI